MFASLDLVQNGDFCIQFSLLMIECQTNQFTHFKSVTTPQKKKKKTSFFEQYNTFSFCLRSQVFNGEKSDLKTLNTKFVFSTFCSSQIDYEHNIVRFLADEQRGLCHLHGLLIERADKDDFVMLRT